jgi:hypothetical protein
MIMEKSLNLSEDENFKPAYIKPQTDKHEPVKVIQGSGSSHSYAYYYSYCGYLYYIALYYY